ncbi:sensor histidine kinase [Arenibacterium sp. CAU 1754]
MLADIHPDQSERLETLHRLGILDTAQEADFDDIVQLASRICETPISLISLVDEDRQWFKARIGFDDAETPLDKSICSHAILEESFFEISDTRNDQRTADNPLVRGDDNIRFYAAAPLMASNGLPIGTLCILDQKPRELNDLQRETLRVLAGQVMQQIELRRALREKEILQGEMDHRVKNSLQTVSSFVRLYRRKVQGEQALEALDAIQRRVDAVSALHEELQYASHVDQVDLQDFLARVASYLQSSAPDRITIMHQVDRCLVHSQKASALGMIISEFVANSIKHGFPDGRRGTVSITMDVAADGTIDLICRDDGVGANGIPADATRETGLGQGLVEASASQLGGVLDHSLTENGSKLTLQFQL